jgi:hypothetical protein
MAQRITDRLNEEIVSIARRCFSGELQTGQAARLIERARRLAQAERLGVPVAEVTEADAALAEMVQEWER